jgi:hypothetical protein
VEEGVCANYSNPFLLVKKIDNSKFQMLIESPGVWHSRNMCKNTLHYSCLSLLSSISGFGSIARYCMLTSMSAASPATHPDLFMPRESVLPRHISPFFPSPRFLHLYLRFSHIFGVCNLPAHRSLINFLACPPHSCILVDASSPSCPQLCRTLPTMRLGPTRWMLHLPSACCLFPMRALVALRLGKVFLFF